MTVIYQSGPTQQAPAPIAGVPSQADVLKYAQDLYSQGTSLYGPDYGKATAQYASNLNTAQMNSALGGLGQLRYGSGAASIRSGFARQGALTQGQLMDQANAARAANLAQYGNMYLGAQQWGVSNAQQAQAQQFGQGMQQANLGLQYAQLANQQNQYQPQQQNGGWTGWNPANFNPNPGAGYQGDMGYTPRAVGYLNGAYG